MPTTITTPAELDAIRSNLAGDYILGANIDLAGYANWEPIGTQAAPFTGTLDGAGYVIQNLTIDRDTTDYVGLFGVIEWTNLDTIPVQKLGIIGANVTGRDYVGVLAGLTKGKRYSTGAVADRDHRMFFKCYSKGAVVGRYLAGGLFGDAFKIKAELCYSECTVQGQLATGGLAGRAYGSYDPPEPTFTPFSKTWLFRCHSTGNVTGLSTQPMTGNLIANSRDATGGLVGELRSSDITESYAEGSVNGGYRVGGLVGATYTWQGSFRCFIYESYARGDVGGIDSVAGLIGHAHNLYLGAVYCTGGVTGAVASTEGAMLGTKSDLSLETPIYYDSTFNSVSNSNGGTARTTLQMQTEATYDDWMGNRLFSKFWIIDPDDEINDGYPQLLWAYDPLNLTLAALSTGHGLLLAYTQEGATKYRVFDGTNWAAAVEVAQLPAPAGTVNLFPTQDGRAGFVVDVDGILHYAVTEALTLAIERSGELLPGTSGALVHLPDDRLKLYFINAVQSLSEAETDLVSWDAVQFDGVTPLPSDSFISRLRAKLIDGRTYAVWRSRGQHRAMVKDEIEVVPEVDDVPAGSIVLRQDTPVVRVSLELDSFEREGVE